jgi:hypothetical protein
LVFVRLTIQEAVLEESDGVELSALTNEEVDNQESHFFGDKSNFLSFHSNFRIGSTHFHDLGEHLIPLSV